MSGKKILVTGGAGFIGSHIVDRLLNLGHEVTVVDNLSSGSIANLPANISLHKKDISDQDLSKVFEKETPEVVFHLAAQISVQDSMRNPSKDAESNVLGSINVLENCVRYNVEKVVYTSSGGAMYGDPLYLPCDEDHPVNPLSHYGVSKFAVENYLHVHHVSDGLNYTVLRLSNVYGPRQDPSGEAGVVAIFTQAMLNRSDLIINGSGEQERDFVYVGDVAEAGALAIDNGNTEAFNICTGRGTSVNEIYRLLKEAISYPGQASKGPAKPGEVFKIYLDPAKAVEKLGWQPDISLESGMRMTVDWFRRTMLAQQSQ
ncbi:uncharacterized protein METZ01_LOCUS190342 [marine metagenome]|uniref:NAD-dependent epimerase/dehydratase domain-containing protein n=1 Tax=marine metagenome TaxID=408172 RepID=A0A382DGI0_9ZZZZ